MAHEARGAPLPRVSPDYFAGSMQASAGAGVGVKISATISDAMNCFL